MVAVGSGGGEAKVARAVVESAVGCCGVMVPFGPPASGGIGFIGVVGVAGEEVDIVQSGLRRVAALGILVESARYVDVHEVPLWAQSVRRGVRDKEEAISGGEDGGI